MPIEDISYTTQPSAESNGRYITVYAPDGSYVSRHNNMEECTESAINYAEANGLEGDLVFRFVPPEKHMRLVKKAIVLPPPTTQTITAQGGAGSVSTNGQTATVSATNPGDAPYDMTGIPARFEAVEFANTPVTTNNVTVNNQTELNAALAVAGNQITLNPAGSYSSLSFSASNVHVIATGATIGGSINLNNGPSILKVTGGTFSGGVSAFGTNSDITFDQVTTNQGWTVQAISGRSLARMTVLNTTVNSPDSQYGLFAFNLRDVIYANCNVTNTDSTVAGMRLIACQGFIAIDSRISTNGNRIIRVHGDGATLPAYDHLIYNCQLESVGSNNLWLGPAAGGAAGRIERFEMHNSRIYYPSAGIGGGWFQMDADVSPGIGDVIVQNNTGYTPDSAVRTGPVPDSPYVDTPNTFNSYQTPPTFTGGATNS